LEHLPVPERVHGPPKSFVSVCHEFPTLDEALEGLHDQLVAFLDVVEYILAENEIPAIDPYLGFLARAHSAHDPLLVKFGQVKGDRRVYGYEATDLAASLETINHIRQRSVGQAIAVIGKKNILILDEVTDGDQALTNVAP